MTAFTIRENPGREQPFTVWDNGRNGHAPGVLYFSATREDAQGWIDAEVRRQQMVMRARMVW